MRVDVNVQIDHAGDVGLAEHGVIQGVIRRDHLVAALDFGVQEAAFGDAMLAAEGAFQFGKELVDGDGGEEAEAAEVDGEERDFAAADGSGGGEQGAVAAEHDDQVAAFGDFMARHAGGEGVDGGFLIDAGGDAALSQPFEQLGRQLDGGWGVGLGDDSHGLNDGHRGETPDSLRRREWGWA